MINLPEENFVGSEPKKKVKKKKPTGILKDLIRLKRAERHAGGNPVYEKDGDFVLWSDVEAIINKYSNP